MAKKMLIDATHAEETRVVVVDGNKVEEFDFETENKRQLAGNIYLAKVSRVEPSLQAAFVEYGGNRHGFLAFSEIHPDYYQIPVADREALLAEERAYAAQEDDEEDEAPKKRRSRSRRKPKSEKAEAVKSDDAVATGEVSEPRDVSSDDIPGMGVVDLDDGSDDDAETGPVDLDAEDTVAAEEPTAEDAPVAEAEEASDDEDDGADDDDEHEQNGDDDQPYAAVDHATELDSEIESVAEEDVAEEIRRPRKPRARKYKIQEVIKVRQILLVQVVKEERGNKGAALTTYLSLAGRYCVLMPNTARGGGISRKITNAADRKKLKQIAAEIDVPDGAGLIVRTAGAKRTKSEIKRDYEYLQRMWEQIRELTLKSIAPAKIYEEGNLIKRSIRDLYNRDIDEVLVEGEGGYRVAKDFMKMIMPSHAKNVKNYADQMPLFARYQVESYLSSMFNPVVQLRSGGYIVIGVTEALVAIDVNSGRATKKGSIEETALETNMEAAEEIARQLRLRDLAGLIVIDFIDMEERKNNASVEKRFKDKLKTDRARIQVGRISGFGLLEMSRQRLSPGMLEATTQPCPHCHGTGLIRSDDNLALSILRQLEEEGTRRKSREVLLKAPIGIVNFLMNQKREHVAQIEARYGMSVRIEADPHLISPDFSIEKFKTATRPVAEAAPVVSGTAALMADIDEAEEEDTTEDQAESQTEETSDDNGDDKPKKRRRRRRRRRGSGNGENGDSGENGNGQDSQDNGDSDEAEKPAKEEAAEDAEAKPEGEETEAAEEKPKKRRRSRSRSRKSAEKTEETAEESTADADAQPEAAEAVAEEAPAEPVAEPVVEPVTEEAAEAPVEAEPVAEEPVAEDVAEAPAEPEAVTEEPVSEAEPEPVAEEVAEVAPEETAEETAEETDEGSDEGAPAVAEEKTPEPAMAEDAADADDSSKPKRRGWWSMGR